MRGVAPVTTDDPVVGAMVPAAAGLPSRVGAHGGDVGRRRPAAAADDPRPRVQEPRHDRPEPRRLGRVDEPALEALRQAGVGHDRARRLAGLGLAEPRQRVEAGQRPDAAVDADGVHAGRGQRLDRGLGRRPVGQHQVLAEGHRRDDRHVRRPVGLVDGQQQVVEVEEGLDHEEVDAALEQPVDLLPEGGPDRGLVGVAELAGGCAQGADAAADPRVPAADVPGLAGDLRRPSIEACRVVGEAVRVEAHPVGAEGQGLDEVGAGVEVLAVERRDEVRAGRRQLVEARALRDPAREQQRAHPAVGEQRGGGEAGGELVAGEAHRGKPSRSHPISEDGSSRDAGRP